MAITKYHQKIKDDADKRRNKLREQYAKGNWLSVSEFAAAKGMSSERMRQLLKPRE